MITTSLLLAKLRGAFRSLTIWVTSGFAATAPMLDYAQEQIPLLSSVLPTNLYQWAFGGLIVASILLRFRTKTALENKVPA